MRFKRSTCSMAAAFIAITIAVQLAAQQGQERKTEHHRYKVVDLGTLGGPASFIPNPWSRDITRRGTVIAEAATLTLDPNSPNCFQPDCLVNHAIKWHKGVRTDLGALPGVNSSFPAWTHRGAGRNRIPRPAVQRAAVVEDRLWLRAGDTRPQTAPVYAAAECC